MLLRTSLFLTTASAIASAQALPDCLLGDQWDRTSLIRRLVDRNGDGVYDSGRIPGQNEVYDYYRPGDNTSFREIIQSPWNANDRYACDGELNETVLPPTGGIVLLRDANFDGFVDVAEASLAFDPNVFFASALPDYEMEGMASDGIALYWISNAGAYEGVWRSVDLNGDGDFMDNVTGTNETTPALVEGTGDPVSGSYTHLIVNAPLTMAALGTPLGAPLFDPTEIQRITFDPTTTPASSAPGRFLIEDELLDQTLAIEDRNNDGDFYDAGEIYLFAATNNTNNVDNPIYRDANPDVPGVIPLPADPGNFAVDSTGPQRIYYLLNKDTAGADANAIYRGIDNNLDGDCNDAGELRIFFQALAADPVLPSQLGLVYIELWGSDLFVVADLLTPADHDAIYRLRDADASGVIDNATEATVVFNLPVDSQSQKVCFFAPGVLAPAPAGLPCMWEPVDTATCMSSVPTLHALQLGEVVLFDELPILGQPFTLRTTGAKPNANAAVHIGFPFGPFPLDVGNTCLVTVNPIVTGPLVVAANGQVDLPLNIAYSVPALGVSLYFQTVAIDLGINPFNVTTSSTVRAQLGVGQYAYMLPW